MPETVLNLLEDRGPGYYLDRAEPEETPYLMNHCRCGHRFDDDYLHGDVGAAFMPDTPEGYEYIELFRLPIDKADPLHCSYTLGGGEYLDFGKVADSERTTKPLE